MHKCMYMHMYSVYVVYIVPMMYVGTCQGFIGVVCSVRLGVLCWSMVQCSMQHVADMALHRSYCVVSRVAAAQGKSAMTKFTNLSHQTRSLRASSTGLGWVLLPVGLG